MNRDVVSDENELHIAVNKILTYAEFLAGCVETYVSIVQAVGSEGIQDDETSPRLAALAAAIQPYGNWILSEANRVRNRTNTFVDEIAEADNFDFPEEITSILRMLFSQFF